MTVRELNGWSPATVTYDANGDVVSVSVEEPRFTPYEVAVLLASRREELAPRGSHGLLLAETTDPELQNAWEVELPTTDFAQERLNAAQAAYQRRKESGEVLPDMGSLLWRVKRR